MVTTLGFDPNDLGSNPGGSANKRKVDMKEFIVILWLLLVLVFMVGFFAYVYKQAVKERKNRRFFRLALRNEKTGGIDVSFVSPHTFGFRGGNNIYQFGGVDDERYCYMVVWLYQEDSDPVLTKLYLHRIVAFETTPLSREEIKNADMR